MDTYWTFAEARSALNVTDEALSQLVLSCNIRSIMITSGTYLLNKSDLENNLPMRERSEYAVYAHLAGVRISIADAVRRYEITQQTISRWVQGGIIKKLGNEGRKTLIDEADMATAAAIYKANAGQGHWAFLKGHPYAKKQKGC